MASLQIQGETASPLGRFLSYSAVVTTTLPVDLEQKAKLTPIPFIYAVMSGLNRLVLSSLQKGPAIDLEKVRIDRTWLQKELAGRARWLGDDAQFESTINKLKECHYLHGTGNEVRVQQLMLDCLTQHARAIWSFMTDGRSGSGATITVADWLRLNEQVFKDFFFGDFGIAWRELRLEVNEKIRQRSETLGPRSGTGRKKNHIDYINRDPHLWIAFNAIALEGPGSKATLLHHFEKYKLYEIAPEERKVDDAAELLVESGALVREGRTYDVAADLKEAAALYKMAIQSGLAAIEADCLTLVDNAAAQ